MLIAHSSIQGTGIFQRTAIALAALQVLIVPARSQGQAIEDIEQGVQLGAIHSEIQAPVSELVRPLLESLCPGRVKRNAYTQLGCDNTGEEPAEDHWRAPDYVDGVIFGHFLAADSEDAVVSGSRHEGHDFHWGGTLLMTNRDGAWKPLWYRSAIITRHCMTVPTSRGRQLLVCELGTGGMGHAQHAIFSLDLQEGQPVQELLIGTDTFDTIQARQTQTVERVEWVATAGAPFLRIHLRHARRECRKEWYECGEDDYVPVDPQPGEYTIDFTLQDSRLVLSTASASLFRRLFPELAKYQPDGILSNGFPPPPITPKK